MTNRRERKRDFWQPNPWRRLLAFLCAFELLISVSDETAYAKNDNTIYSAPVTAPIRNPETPQPEEAAETPEPEGATVNTEEHTEVNSETEEPTETETTAENPEDNHNEQEEMPAAEETTWNQEDIPAAEETDIESGEKTETGTEGEETETAEAAGEEAVTEENKEEIPPAPEKNYTSGNLQAETEGCSVQINYTEAACIPDETTLTVTQARGADLYAALKSAAKVIRNEEDEIWKRQIADEGNAFYLLSLTDAEGNEVYPGAQVELILEQKNRPDGTTCFLTGENARILDEEEGKISVTDYSMEPVGYATIQLIQTGIVTKEYSGADYIVTASYGPEANFPANTEMKVREIRPDTPEYALYSGLTEEALAEEWNEITLERYFDITFISGGKEVEPSGNVDVQIVFKDMIELTEEHDIQAVHFENKEAVVIESETDSIDEEAKRSEEVIDTVSFTSDSFSVFGVVQRTKITQKMLAADGNTYEINVTYGPDAGIPENAELLVEEIIPGSDLWEAYRKQTAAALGADDVRLPGLYDISILVDGQKIEPLTPVNVSVRLVNAESGEELHVVHFTEELPEKLVVSGDKQTEVQSLATEERIASEKITDAVVEGDTVTFDTDGFSVYAFAYTVVVYYRTVSGENYRITLDYGPDSGIPAGAELQVEELLPGDERYTEYLEKALRTITSSEDAGGPVDENVDEAAENEADGEDKEEIIEDIFIPEDQYARFFDIEIRADGQKIEPTGSVSVTFELVDAPEERINDLKVVHFTDDNTDILNAEINTETGVRFETDAFSVYGVILAPSLQPQGNLEDLDSRTFTISHGDRYLTAEVSETSTRQFKKTTTPGNAALWTFEATGTARVYRIFTTDIDGNKLYMNLNWQDNRNAHAALSSNPQDFTITSYDNGYTLSTVSNNTTYYLNEFNRGDGFAGWYARNSRDDVMTLNFKDNAIQMNKQYMALVKYNNKYYIVNNDASLTEVEYDPVFNRVKTENPMLWTVEGTNPNRHIYFNSEATGYDWQQLASDYYRRYLNPAAANAITEENSGNVQLDNGSPWWDAEQNMLIYPSTVRDRSNILRETALNYYNQRGYREPWNGNNHFGVELDGNGTPVRLIGKQSADNSVEILFADATEVNNPEAKNHTVNHIDISIAGKSKVNVPLAYGTYYYEDPDTHEMIEYEVVDNTTLDLGADVAFNSEDMKHATIKAYDKNNKELNDAFVITGYSSNAHTNISTVQVRIEGSFKVANLDPVPDGSDPEAQAIRGARLNNKITYVVSAIKNLDFDMVDPQKGQLYEKQADGTYKKLSINIDVDMTASFQYYDAENECPPLQPSWGDGSNNYRWRFGGIPAGSGMDFILGGDAEAASSNVVAIEVTKQIIDESGKLIHPSQKIIHSVDIYGNTEKDANGLVANANSVSDLNVGQYTTDYNTTGYEKFHSKNIAVGPTGMTVVYDYAIKPGMYYVTEDKNTVAESFVDTAGDTWEYKGTYITTEYVRRGNQYDDRVAYPDPQHYSKTYTMDDPVFAAVPEVVGTFKRLDNVEKKNGIVEFYIYNVYVNTSETSLEAEKQWAEGTEVPENAEVTFELYYAKRQKTNNGELIENPTDWPDYEDYLPVKEDPIFESGINKTLTLTANESEMMNWKGIFTGLPKTWRDGNNNDWELDYYAKETAVTVNGENCIDQYINTTVKEDAPAGEADSSDGKVTITNAIQKASVTVHKDWLDNASHYDGESITVKLIRYKKAEPVPPDTGVLRITHVAEGLSTSALPEGFEVTYTISGNSSISGVEAGDYKVKPGEYTVTANVISFDPDGYTYVSTTESITVTVSAGETRTVRFVSTFTETTPEPKNNGILKLRKEGLPADASGFAAKYTVTGPDNYRQEVLFSQFTNGEYELNNLKTGSYTVKEEVTGEINGYRRTSAQTTTLEVDVVDDATKTATFIGQYNLIPPDEYTTVILYVNYSNSNDYNSNVETTVTIPKNTDVYLTCSAFDHGNYIAHPEIFLYYWDVTSNADYPHWTYIGTIGAAPYTGNIHIGNFDRYCIRIHQDYNDRNMGTYSLSANNSDNNRDRTLHAVRYRTSSGMVSAGRLRTSAMPDDYNVDRIIEIDLNAAGKWQETIDNLDIYDRYGEAYYYGIEEASVPSGYNVSYNPNSPVIATELEGIILEAKNTYISPTTGNLVVSKTITGNAANMTKAFTFTVIAKNADDQPIPDGSYGEMIFTDGIATFTLSNGESKTAEDLPDGTVVNVSENPDEYIFIREGDQDGPIPAGVTKYISYTNSLNTFGDLEISKIDTSEEIDTSKSFEFTITLEGHTGEETYSTTKVSGEENINDTLTFVNGIAEITLKHQESLTIRNLPNGARYSVNEADYTPEYFEPIVTNASGTIVGGENSKVTASFINKADTVKIIADKKWPDFSDDVYTWSATFRLLADGVPTGDTITIGKDTPETDRSFGNLPRNKRVDDEIQEIVYSMEEVSYTVYENGNPVFSFDGTNYVPSNVRGQYIPYYAVTEGENGEKIYTCTNIRNTAQFFVKKKWVGVIDPSSMPTVSFSLKYYVEGQQPHSARVYDNYENIELSAPDWTWTCPEELPLEINGKRVTYFAEEYAHGKQVVYDTDAYHIPPSLKHKYIIEIDGYENSYGANTNEFNQPFNAGITGNTGTITIRNKAPDYMQMDLKKKFLEYRTDENGATSLYTTTGDTETMRDTIIKIQMMRIVIDERSGTDVFLTGWEEYGDAVMLGYDTNGNSYVDCGDNPFVVIHQGSWAFQIINSGYTYGLPRYGFYNQGTEATPDIIPVRYRYAFKEIEVFDGNLNSKEQQWVSWLPYAWDGNGNKYKLSTLQEGQGWDRMLNGTGTSLHIEKEWTGSPAPNIAEVYIRVERREFGTNGNYEDYLAIIDNEQNLGKLAQNHFVSKNDVYTHINIGENESIPVLKLNAQNGWKVDINYVQVFPNGNNSHRQYEYRIVEVGYKNADGTVIYGTDSVNVLFEPSYYRQGIEDNVPVEQGNGLPVTVSGPNILGVVNTSQTGLLEIIKQVPEVSTEKAAEKSFVFNVELNLPAGTTLNQEDLSISGGTIGEDIHINGTSVEFAVTVQGAGIVTIKGIPFGTTYTVTEDTESIPVGWEEIAQSDEEKYSDSGKQVSKTDTQPDTVTIVNREITSVSVVKIWKVNGEETVWPEEVDSITVCLYRSVNGEESPVLNEDETPKILIFDKNTNLEERTFSRLPVYDEGEPVYDDDGKPVPIKYTIHELGASYTDDPTTAAEVTEEGTVTVGDYTWIVSVGEPVDGLITITNNRMEIHILKVDIETDPKEYLTGAKFILKRKNIEGQYVTVTGYEALEVDEYGEADIRNLEDGDYRLLETKAPAGYIPMGMPVEFTVTNGAVASFEDTEYVAYNANNQTFTIGNKAGLALPSTGGSGTQPYTVGGLSLILMAVLLKLMKKRRKNYQ